MAFLDMISELTGTLPGLSPLLAQIYINRAYKEVLAKRAWSFLVTDGVVVCPTQITDGTAALTQSVATVTLDADASAAIAPQLVTGSVPGVLNLQIRFGSAPSSGQIYSIVAFDNTTPTAVVLTLDRPLVEATSAAASYKIYRCYVTPPITDFLRWESFVDYSNAIRITNDKLRRTSAQLDISDPQRASQGLAYFVASWGGNRISNPVTGATIPNALTNQSTPIYELWPHPVQGQTFYVRIRRRGADLVQPFDELPQQISDSIVISRALAYHAYPFAKANVANFPTFKGANWTDLILTEIKNYNDLLLDAKRNDDAQQLQTVWNRGHGLRAGRPFGRYSDLGYPIDSDYLQQHLVRF